MKENRSFDHLLGKLHDQGQTASEPLPDDFRNPTSSSHIKFVGPFHAPTTCWTQDPGHQWTSMHLQVNAGLMDGFVITLPRVTFVDGVDNVEDEHPTADVQHGEAWTRNIYEHARASRYWSDIALIWTYDEGGGFFDHVPPPEHLCIARPQDSAFYEAGVRVPLAVISPWARPHYVSHVVQDHTAITRFLETLFDLPALTARDANNDAPLDMFDFTHPALMDPPDAPEAGSGGCEELVLSLDKPLYAPGDPITVTFTNAPGTRRQSQGQDHGLHLSGVRRDAAQPRRHPALELRRRHPKTHDGSGHRFRHPRHEPAGAGKELATDRARLHCLLPTQQRLQRNRLGRLQRQLRQS